MRLTQLFLTFSNYVTCMVQVAAAECSYGPAVRFVNILILTWETSKDDEKLPICPYLETLSSHAIVTRDSPCLLLAAIIIVTY